MWKLQLIWKSMTWKYGNSWLIMCSSQTPTASQLCDTYFICLTALDPTRSATNSTVRRKDGGWLWKKACSRSTFTKGRIVTFECWILVQAIPWCNLTFLFTTSPVDSPAVSAATCWHLVYLLAQQKWEWSCELFLHSWLCFQTQRQLGAYETHLERWKQARTLIHSSMAHLWW